jgi:hypothetical protein
MKVISPVNVLPGNEGVVTSTFSPGLIHGKSCS